MTESLLFTDDLPLKKNLYGKLIRSPVPKGRLRSISLSGVPSTYTLITAGDIPGKNQLKDMPVPILADAELTYTGEPLALLIGPDWTRLEEYAPMVSIEIDQEAAFYSHDSFSSDAILGKRTIRSGGDIKNSTDGETIIEGNYKTGIQEHWYSDPHGAVALYFQDKLEIHTATQWPFHVRSSVASMLDITAEEVIVYPSRIGLHLDGKIWYPSLVACHAALAAYICKKSVKIMLTREEDFRYSPKRCNAEIRIRSTLDKKGKLLGNEINVITDLGAQGIFTDEILDRISLASSGVYNNGYNHLDGFAVRTNIPPQGPFCGFGLSQGFFAAERHASKIADALGVDPAEWRKNNLIPPRNRRLSNGIPIREHIPLNELLDAAGAMSDYPRKWASYELLRKYRRESPAQEITEPLRGIGIATAYQGSGFLHPAGANTPCSVELTLDKEGSLTIKTSMVSSSRENTYLWVSIASEILSLDPGHIRVTENNTLGVPDSGPSTLSRNITVITKLVERSCSAIRKQRFRDPLPITVKRSYHPAKGEDWNGTIIDQNALGHLCWGCGAVEIEIDPVEYNPRIRGVWLAVDAGKLLSEAEARRTLKHSAIQALGWVSREHVSYVNGEIPDREIRAYDIYLPREIPPVAIDFIWNDTVNPRGIGEIAFNCIPAAYAQAVSQAMDHHFDAIPISSGDIWAVRQKKREEDSR